MAKSKAAAPDLFAPNLTHYAGGCGSNGNATSRGLLAATVAELCQYLIRQGRATHVTLDFMKETNAALLRIEVGRDSFTYPVKITGVSCLRIGGDELFLAGASGTQRLADYLMSLICMAEAQASAFSAPVSRGAAEGRSLS